MWAWSAATLVRVVVTSMASGSGPQTVSGGLANTGGFQLTFRANRLARELTIPATEPTLNATSSQTAMWTQIQRVQYQKGLAVRKNPGSYIDSNAYRPIYMRFPGYG